MAVMVTARHAGGRLASGAAPAVIDGRWPYGSGKPSAAMYGIPSGRGDQRKRLATSIRSNPDPPLPIASPTNEATCSKSV